MTDSSEQAKPVNSIEPLRKGVTDARREFRDSQTISRPPDVSQPAKLTIPPPPPEGNTGGGAGGNSCGGSGNKK